MNRLPSRSCDEQVVEVRHEPGEAALAADAAAQDRARAGHDQRRGDAVAHHVAQRDEHAARAGVLEGEVVVVVAARLVAVGAVAGDVEPGDARRLGGSSRCCTSIATPSECRRRSRSRRSVDHVVELVGELAELAAAADVGAGVEVAVADAAHEPDERRDRPRHAPRQRRPRAPPRRAAPPIEMAAAMRSLRHTAARKSDSGATTPTTHTRSPSDAERRRRGEVVVAAVA